MVQNKGRRKIFYGWWILLATTISHALSGGFYTYGFGAFFMPLVEEFGWSRAAISGVYSLSRIEGGLLGPAGGWLIDKFGPRKMTLIGVTIMGAGLIWFSQIDSLIAFYLIFILGVALGSNLAIHLAALVAIANWFVKKRGLAIGIRGAGIGLGGMLVPVLTWFIVQHGWREAAIAAGLTVWVVGIPLGLVMRHRPEQYGYLPDGETKEESLTQTKPETAETDRPSSTTPAKESSAATDADFTLRQSLKTKAFWLLALIFGLRGLVVTAVVVHQIPFLTGIGIAPELAATMLGSIAVISIVGRLGFGRLADTFDKRYIMAICLGLIAIGCFILVNAQTWWHFVLFLIIYPPAYGGVTTVEHAIRGEYFGRQHFGTIMGFMSLIQVFGTVLGPVFAGWIFDITESYRLAFLTFAIAAAIATLLMLIARRPVLAPDAARG